MDELARRIDLILQMNLGPLWPKVTLVPRDVPFTTTAAGVLQIEPVIMESKLVDSLEREVFTWGMGDSLVVIKVLFKDGATGEAVAEPVFLRRSSLFWASWSGGFTDREIEREITRDICNYARDNF